MIEVDFVKEFGEPDSFLFIKKDERYLLVDENKQLL